MTKRDDRATQTNKNKWARSLDHVLKAFIFKGFLERKTRNEWQFVGISHGKERTSVVCHDHSSGQVHFLCTMTAKTTDGPINVETKEDVRESGYQDSDDDSLSGSTDDESDSGPPPVIAIEKSADFGTLKSTFMSNSQQPEERTVDKEMVVERLGKENLVNITSAFEGMKTKEEIPEKTERVPLTVVDKERYSQYKEKFEHIQEAMDNRRTSLTNKEDIKGAGKEVLSQTKDKFERLNQRSDQAPVSHEKVDIGLSPDDKQRIKETFSEVGDAAERSDCAICGRVVYPMEKVQLEKKVFHKGCFRCCRCLKNLSVQNYSSHEGNLYCKVHMMQLFHPEIALAFERENATADTNDAPESDEESDYAIVRRPKELNPSIVKSSLKTADDLGQIPSLSNRRSMLEQNQERKTERKTEIDDTLSKAGNLKEKLSKFAKGDAETEDASKAQREQIVLEVGAKEIKSKWESGAVEKAELRSEDRVDELDALKATVKVRERFKEKEEGDKLSPKSVSQLEADLDTSFSRESRAHFLKGSLFQGPEVTSSGPKDEVQFSELGNVKKKFESAEEKHIERPELVDARCTDMGNIKAAFEASQNRQEEKDRLQELKKLEIESEFKRIKKEKRRLQEKERRESEERAQNEVKTVSYEDLTDVRQCAELNTIKERFEQGRAFADEEASKRSSAVEPDVEIKVAPKAREKFKQLAMESPVAPLPAPAASKESKWSKQVAPVPEPVNRRVVEQEDEEPEDFEVKHLLNKFRNIGQEKEEPKGPKPQRTITPPPEGYKAEVESIGKERLPGIAVADISEREPTIIKTDAKNLRQKFEQTAAEQAGAEQSSEKRKLLEEEFRKFKEEKELVKDEPAEVNDQPDKGVANDKDDLAVAAEHAQKMRAKWEKIQKKEAKKAKRGVHPKKPSRTVDPDGQ
uniref:LIM zinc-binding domain-containing protein n=1 Tax=Trichuris muris TaxID=70415 RepID=A0A5S6R158_TRIMR